HALTEGLIAPRRMVQIGIRSPVSREVHDWTLAQGVTTITAQEVHETGPAPIAARVREIVGDAPVYLSFDIDVLDPAFAPGTGTPEISGLLSHEAQAFLRALAGVPFVGFDVVEVSPTYDGPGQVTALQGATIAFEMLALTAV